MALYLRRKNMLGKLKNFIFFAFTVSLLGFCQNRRAVAETEFDSPPQKLIDMSRMMSFLDIEDSYWTEYYKSKSNWTEIISALSDEKRKNKKVFEDIVWRGSVTLELSSSVFEKKLLFHNGYFIIEDGIAVWRRFRAYGRYTVDREGRIVCNIQERYFERPDASLEEYYKAFLENDTIIFTIKYDPGLYYHQWQMSDLSGDEIFYGIKDQYASPDMIYDNDGVKLYKYEGGIKWCTSMVNLREKPSLDAKIIAVLDAGRHVKAEARTTIREKIDNKEDCWYYVYYAVDDKYIPVYGYVFGGYLEEAPYPEEVDPSDILSGIDTRNITEADIKYIRERLIGNTATNTSGHVITYKKYIKPRYFETVDIGAFCVYSKNEYVSIFIFERFLGRKGTKAIHAIENIIVYPHKTMKLYCQQVHVWAGSETEDNNITVWGLYKYPRDGFIGFEVVYYPQEVIIIDNKTGEMNLMPNRNNKYSFFTGE
jgi:hypothetical protein